MGRVLIPTTGKPGQSMQLSRLAADCIGYLAATGKQPNTLAQYEIAFRQFATHVTSLGLDDDARHFVEERVMSFMVAMHKAGATANTIRARLSALTTLAKYGAKVKDGRGRPVVPLNPLAGIDRPRRKRPPEKFLLPEELAAFLEVPRPIRISIVRDLLVDTGLRVSELCGVDVQDLTFIGPDASLQVRVKGGEVVRLPISPGVAELLKDWLLSRNMPDPGEPLLLGSDGKRLNRSALAQMLISIGRAAGIRRFAVRPHTIRHTVEIIRRRAKIDPTVRSKLLAHSNLSSLTAYQHTLPEELIEARRQQVEGLQAYLKAASDYADGLCGAAVPVEPKQPES